MHRIRSGDVGELIAMLRLIEAGFDVGRMETRNGPVDIVAVHPVRGFVWLLDVKRHRHNKSASLTANQKRMGVELVHVDYHTGQLKFASSIAQELYEELRDIEQSDGTT